MLCPHCNKEIEDKLIAHHLASKAGKKSWELAKDKKDRAKRFQKTIDKS